MEYKISEAVQRGVEYLEERESDWADKVDLDYLDMIEWPSCVYGQVFGVEHGPDDKDVEVECGFSLPEYLVSDDAQWELLQYLWSNEIAKRQNV
jgi:hypothetical protein